MDAKSVFPFPGEPEYEARVLDRYFAGESTDEERQAIDHWIETNPRLADKIATLRYKARFPSGARSIPAAAGLLAGFRAKIELEERRSVRKTLWRGMDSLGSRTLRGKAVGFGTGVLWFAGAISIAAIIAVAVWTLRVPRLLERDVTKTYATTDSQGANVLLDDGTRITLLPRTTLHLSHFGAHARTVTLDGEAYFSVSQRSNIPFIVRSGAYTTRVLGTEFFMRHRGQEAHAHVAVRVGKVRVISQRGPSATLVAGAIGDVTDSTVYVRTLEASSQVEQRGDQLVFHRMPVSTVLATLSQWYGYHFRCADSAIVQKSITIAVSMQSPSSALATLEQILGVNFAVTGDTVTVIPRQALLKGETSRKHTYDIWTPKRESGR